MKELSDVGTGAAITASSLPLMGLAINEWALILSCIYLILQIGFLLRDRLIRKGKCEKDNK